MENDLKSQRMREQPIGKLLAAMSFPAILSMLVQALYNVVDSVFVSRLPNAIEALSIAFPMQMLIIAFACGVGIGANAQIARKLGERSRQEANLTAKTGLFLALCCSAAFVVLGLAASGPFIRLFTDVPEVADMGTTYLTIVMTCSFGCIIEITCSKMLQATGNMLVPMISQLLGAGLNIVLDPILIFGLLGMPAMGVAGAAVATVIGQISAMVFVLLVYKSKKQDIDIWLDRSFRPRATYILGICRIGIPTMVMNAVASVTTTFMNLILKAYASGIAILGIYFKVQSFVFMPVFGLMQGAMPIMSYNYGANNKKRFLHTFYLTLGVSIAIMAVGTVLFQCFPGLIMRLFDSEGDQLTNGIYALRVISLCFVVAAVGITLINMFQALGYGVTSLVMSLVRQVVFIIPLAAVLSALFGLNGVWFCYPIAELLCVLIFAPVSVVCIRRQFARRQAQQEALDPLPAEAAGECVASCEDDLPD